MMNRLIALLIVYLVVAIGLTTGTVIKETWIQERNEFYAESACVREYIAMGIERRDIRTGDGKCHVVR